MRFIAALFALLIAAPVVADEYSPIDTFVVESPVPEYGLSCDCQDWQQWHLVAHSARDAWATYGTGSAIKIAIIDTGIDTTGFEFTDNYGTNLWTNPNEDYDGVDDDSNSYIDDVKGCNFIDYLGIPASVVADSYGQGTLIASVMAARGPTMAYRGVGITHFATIMVLRVKQFGGGQAQDVADAINYARLKGAKIILGTGTTDAVHQPTKDAIAAFTAAGGLTIWESGNGNIDSCAEPCTTFGGYPPKHDDAGMLVVGTASRFNGSVGYWANHGYGPTSVDMHAIGRDISSAAGAKGVYTTGLDEQWGQWFSLLSGPAQVAGAAALMWSRTPSLTAADVKAYLMQTVDVHSGLDGRSVTEGTLNVEAAMEAADEGGGGEIDRFELPTIVVRPEDNKTYDVQGRRVDANYQGVKFVNGRKRVEVKP